MSELPPEIRRTEQYPGGKALVGIVLVAAVFVMPVWLVDDTSSEAAPLVDLSDAVLVEIRTLDDNVVMSGELRNHVDSMGNIEKDAALLGRERERVIGEVEIEIPRRDAVDPRQELEIDVISLQPRSTYRLFVNDQPVVTFATDDRGSIDVEFRSPPARTR